MQNRNTHFLTVQPGRQTLLLPILLLMLFVSQLSIQTASAEELKFAWPVPSRVTVTEETLKKGKTAKMRYDIVLNKQSSGDNYELNFDKFEFLAIEGTDLSIPENREQAGAVLKQATALGSMLPTLVITPKGNVVDVIGMEKCIDAATALLSSADPKVIELIKSPEMVEQMKQKSVDFWRVWVETWLTAPESGKVNAYEMEVPIMGVKLQAPLTVRNEGSSKETGSDVKLIAETVLEGEKARQALATMMQNMVAKIPQKEGVKPFSPDMIKSMKRVTRFTVVTNPKTLQPRSASSDSLIDLAIEDKQRSEIEKHDYSFDWKSGTN
ncbi:hypothetical protein KF707_18440 [Candidatus Obscuribacterales bacterium]|nr:hypothetical protein [Candidatus Obscuribacterales bacterium]MBX3138214.1 hypothetical protein [Candidatus Obscuribacterales bacterium]